MTTPEANRPLTGDAMDAILRDQGADRSRYLNPSHAQPKPERDGVSLGDLLQNTVSGGPEGDCLEWTGSLDHGGYGVIHKGGKKLRAHRLALEASKGLPDGQFALHKCDNRRCINPAHLFSGSLAENNRDMMEKGRHVALRGEEKAQAKLTEENVREIHTSPLSQRVLARKFGVDQKLICRIRKGEAWAHLHPDRTVLSLLSTAERQGDEAVRLLRRAIDHKSDAKADVDAIVTFLQSQVNP